MKNCTLIFTIVITLALMTASCSAPATPPRTPTEQPTQPRPADQPPGNTPVAQPSLFKFIRNVTVTPDEAFQIAALGRMHYIPATDRLVVILATEDMTPDPPCQHTRLHAYKEYTLDMQPTGNYSIFNCWGGDAISLMVDNSFYFAADGPDEDGTAGWWLYRYDAVTWKQVGKEFHVDVHNFPAEHTDGPSLTYVNGMIDLFDVYAISGGPVLAPIHHFFTTDLEPIEVRTLAEGPATYGSSLIYVDGVYNQINTTGPDGGMVVNRYDQTWKFLDTKTVRQNAMETSAQWDGQRFYVSFLDNSQSVSSGTRIFSVHLAAFDRDWKLIEDVPVTMWTQADAMQTEGPGLLLHAGRLYVTYTAHEVNPETYQECPDPTKPCRIEDQVYVSVYEMVQISP